ncbi:MAG: cysteine hydrolase [Actinomycetia bacterium]|nr:cysteine hydrolase [Actinomycetes bacterium]
MAPVHPAQLHTWAIEAHEYERHEKRRGRRHAFERLDPARTALTVIDMVPFFVAENSYARGIVPHINSLAHSLRAAGGIVAWVVPDPEEPSEVKEQFYGPEVASAYRTAGGNGPIRDRLWLEFDVATTDLLVGKTAPSAFFPGRCELHALLQNREIDTVLVAGTVANVCCESTARDANTLGYQVIMIADANAAPTDETLNATLRTIYRSFGDVRPSSEVLQLIADSTVTCA